MYKTTIQVKFKAEGPHAVYQKLYGAFRSEGGGAVDGLESWTYHKMGEQLLTPTPLKRKYITTIDLKIKSDSKEGAKTFVDDLLSEFVDDAIIDKWDYINPPKKDK